MPFGAAFRELVAANAPLWASEAEVFRTYWDWPGRSRESDLLWLARQYHKEFWGGGDAKRRGLFAAPLEELSAAIGKIDRGVGHHEMLAMAAELHQEFSHYCAFADAYDAIKPAEMPVLDPAGLKDRSWPENDALSELRAAHREQHGEIGRRAHRFTEGGYCGLFREGMNLAGRGAVDDAIAAACAKVHTDVRAYAGRHIHMRNAQFGNPLPEARIAEIPAGGIAPVSFDYEKAESLLP